jgi:DNA-binding response OmpR family regulator
MPTVPMFYRRSIPKDRRAGGLCVLVADPDPATRAAVTTHLRLAGLSVVEADSGGEALELASTTDPHVLVIDAQLPGMDGEQVVRALRAQKRTAALPIVLCKTESGWASEKLGADVVVFKPCPPAELLARIRALLR